MKFFVILLFVTLLTDILGLRVGGVGGVAERGLVRVRGQLMVQLLWAVYQDGKTLHLQMTKEK